MALNWSTLYLLPPAYTCRHLLLAYDKCCQQKLSAACQSKHAVVGCRQCARWMGMADLCNAHSQSSKNVGLRFSDMSPTNVFCIVNSLASNRQLGVFYGLNSVWHVATGVGVDYTTALGYNFVLIPIHPCKGLSPGRNLYRDGGYVEWTDQSPLIPTEAHHHPHQSMKKNLPITAGTDVNASLINTYRR